MPLIPVESLDDPRLTVYRDIKATRHSKWAGRFVAEGKRLVRRMLLSGYEIESVILSEHQVPAFESWLSPDIPTFVMSQRLAAELVGYNFHCGAMACAKRKPSPSLSELLGRGGSTKTLIVCPDVNDPENIGTLIRLGAAFGIDGLLLGPACADPFSRRVLRVSMGNALTLPIAVSRDLRSDLLRLKSDSQFQLIATVVENNDPTDDDLPPVESSEATQFMPVTTQSHSEDDQPSKSGVAIPDVVPLHSLVRPPCVALLFGNEAHGLSDDWLDLCDQRATIPMHGADSLNVAVAAGIFLYHLTNGRTGEHFASRSSF